MRKRVLSFALALCLLLALVPSVSPVADAVSEMDYAPYAKRENDYTTSVESGTIRYICQNPSNSAYFHSEYWPANSFGEYAGPGTECFTASISMALSYININYTPIDILGKTGITSYDGWAEMSQPSISEGMARYLSGNGSYSPVIIHLREYSGSGHYVVLAGQISENTYYVLDPWEPECWSITINGSNATYYKDGEMKNDTILGTGSASSTESTSCVQYYNPNSVICTHNYSDTGICSNCQRSYPWMATMDTSCAGYYKVRLKGGTYPRRDCPYSAGAKLSTLIEKGKTVKVDYSIVNHYGNLWYHCTCDGVSGYINSNNLEFSSFLSQNFTCSMTSPAEGAAVPKNAYPVIGSLTSPHYSIKGVKAYLDGVCFAIVSDVNATSLDLRGTAINHSLDFAALSTGSHVLRIDARDETSTSFVTVLNRTFYTEVVSVPTNQTVSTNLSSYILGDPVTITPNASGASSYAISIWQGAYSTGKLVFASYDGFTGSINYTPEAVGTYTVRIDCRNSAGYVSTECTFTVKTASPGTYSSGS